MTINELEEHKYYKAKDKFYTYVFRFKAHKIIYNNYALIFYEQLYRKVGVEILYSSDAAVSIEADTQFELISDNIASKLFKVMEIAISTINTLI